jgi:uncharacterized membrane protein YccC
LSPSASQTNHISWAALWQLVTRVQRDKIAPALALRNSIGVALPLAVGVATGAIPAGLAIATGALNASFTDSSEPYRVRGQRMLGASVLVGFAVAVGEICGRHHPMAVAITTGWGFAAGLLVALSSTAADLGVISLVTLIVYSAVPAPPERALMAGILAFCGGLLQTALSLALWPLQPYAPERRALGDLYLEISRSASQPIEAMTAPPASGHSTLAQQSLATLGRDHTVEGERYRALLSQAERIRLSLMMLGRLRVRIRREARDSAESKAIDRYFEIAASLLNSIGEALRAGKPASLRPDCLQELETLTESLRASGAGPAMQAMLLDARYQMDALLGQLRSAVDLAAHATPEGLDAYERRESGRPWSLRLMGTFAILRANLSLGSAACRHAVRLAVCVAAADALSRGMGFKRFYWLPMTVAIILKPDFSATFSRGVLRLAGTFAGLALATALFHLTPAGAGLEVVLVFAFMFAVRCFGPANYGIFVVGVTGLVVVLIAMTGAPPGSVIAARGWNTAVGGAIALAAYWLWPTWERKQIREAAAKLLDAYRGYFHVIRQAYEHPDGTFARDLDQARQGARLARSNLEASVDRLVAEPGTTAELVGKLSGILANSHRLVHGLMALEAGLARSHPVPPRAQFPPFANQVEMTLYYLAAGLRGSPLELEHLPDLREAHHALVRSGDSLTERYALVNVETDRITNSLNTLAGEILDWLTPPVTGPAAGPVPVRTR